MKILRNSGTNSNKWLYLACCAVMILIFAGIDGMIILGIIGLLDFWAGAMMCRGGHVNSTSKSMIITGIYIFVLSVIYLTGILTEDLYWKIFGGGLLIIVVISFILFRKK